MTDTELPQPQAAPESREPETPKPDTPATDAPLAPPVSDVPPFGTAPYAFLDPAGLEAERIAREQRRAEARRTTRNWAWAAVAALVIGGAISWAISLPQRTDVPGLKTAVDGRYDFPPLALPALPAGQPAPYATDNLDAQRHLTDIRKLLLPMPTGAASVGAGANGWLADASTLFAAHDSAKTAFAEYGLRHTATESWKTTDGATTTIYLLQFTDGKAASNAQSKLTNDDITAELAPSLSLALAGVPSGSTSHSLNVHIVGLPVDYTTVKADGKATRYGALIDGDAIGIVVQSGPADLPQAPFTQVMMLQAQMLE